MLGHSGRGHADGVGSGSLLDRALEEIERIARLDHAVIRNLWITYRYHTLMQDLASVIGNMNANWSTFATWASKTAGQSIRGEEVPAEFRELLSEEAKLHERIAEVFAHLPGRLRLDLDPLAVPRAILDEVSSQIATGNLLVFAELAPLFARFAAEFSAPDELTEANLKSFVAPLRKGPADADGQDLLKVAFTSYFLAAREASPKPRAEYTLHGNLLIGLHEQTRLQSYIAGALDAPFAERTYDRLLAKQPDWLELATRPVFRGFIELLKDELQHRWERLATRYLMRLTLPNGQSLSLGQDIPVGARPFPEVLNPLEYATLRDFVRTYDADLDDLRGSGARNWTKLGNRMAFIADLFRSRQQDSTLFEPPFREDQIAVLRLGRVPDGPL